jgi:hypothetical protein
MEAIHRQLGTPLLTDLALEPEGFTIEPDSLVPERLPDLFAGAPVLVLGRFQGQPAGRMEVQARAAAGLAWCQALEGNPRDNPAIASAWARGQVRKLEDRYVVAAEDLGALERQIVAVSLRFGVLCRFTAYVAIDHAETANEGGKLHRITQPVESPQGWALLGGVSAPMLQHPSIAAYRSEFRGVGQIRRSRIADVHRRMPAPPPPPSNAPGSDDTGELALSQGQILTNVPSQYQIRRQIGMGGLGGTFEAFDRNRGQSVSITMHPGSADKLERIQSLMGLSHPSLALALDAGRCGEGIFFVTPSEGQGIRLNQVLKDRRPEPVESARWIAEIAEAVQYLNEHGVLCWDVEPGTIVLDPAGRAMLTDLWEHVVTAQEAPSAQLCGTPAYMPPELFSAMGRPLDCRCATYSLGIVLYELLTGIRPFSGSSVQETLQNAQTTTPRAPRAVRRSIPKALEAICLKAMARKPEDRYATPGDLARALRQFLSGQTDRKESFWKRK